MTRSETNTIMLIILSRANGNLTKNLSILAYYRCLLLSTRWNVCSVWSWTKGRSEGEKNCAANISVIYSSVSQKMSEARTTGTVKSEYFDLDEVLDSEIKFGKYQIFQFLLIAFPIFLNGIFTSTYIFTAGTLNYRYCSLYFRVTFLTRTSIKCVLENKTKISSTKGHKIISRCRIPECEENGEIFRPGWLNTTTPFVVDTEFPEKCSRYRPINDDNTEVADSCSSNYFNRFQTVDCDEYVYEDNEVTILNTVRVVWTFYQKKQCLQIHSPVQSQLW